MCEGGSDPVGLDDAALNLAITGSARAEAAVAGYRLAAIAELATRRLGGEVARSREYWAADAWDSCAAEISADLTISHRKASGLLHQGLDLRYKLPRVGALLLAGDITVQVATTASWRTKLIEDADLMAKVDTAIAKIATRLGSYSQQKLADAIDAKVHEHDPDAVRRFKAIEKTLDVQFGKPDDDTGTRSVYGRMKLSDAELMERRAEALATSVCPNDPRTHGERRTEAWGVIAAMGAVLPCLCGTPDCPAPTGPDARGKHFEILVITDDPDAGTGEQCDGPAPDPDDEGPRYDPDRDWQRHWPDPEPCDECDQSDAVADDRRGAETTSSPTTPAPCSYTSIIAGGGVLPAPLLAGLHRMGATVRPVVNPEDLTAEPGYRPSVAMQRFVRARDMTCTFIGCDHPAEYCDTDHTTPYGPGGLTHPGNTKALCRKHHLLKTFWVGKGGWADEQLADGTVVWTSPSGLKHRATPGSRIHFPDWDTTTPLPQTPPAAREPAPGRDLRMPLRKRTRARQQAASIRAERERNRREADENPPPF